MRLLHYPDLSRLFREQKLICLLAPLLSFGVLVAGCAVAAPDSGDDNVEDRLQALGGNLNMTTRDSAGHSFVNVKAFQYLQERGQLPQEVNTSDTQKLVVYGGFFADEQWLGRPEAPYTGVWNHITASASSANPPVMTPKCAAGMSGSSQCNSNGSIYFSQNYNNSSNGCHGLDVEIGVHDLWTSDNSKKRPTVTPWFIATVRVDGYWMPEQNANQEYALDNMFHYGYADLADIGANTTRNMIMYPAEGSQLTLDCLADWLRNREIVSNAGFGVAKYGAVLYQMSRRFFENGLGYSDPRLSLLQRAGQNIPGWSTGGNVGGAAYPTINTKYQSTYLGGNPFICAGGGNTMDTCLSGRATWPIWVPATYSASQKDAFLAQLEQNAPGRRNNAALIYLGWAAHMLQDAAMPHHASNWTGKEHAAQDDIGKIMPFIASSSIPSAWIRKCSDGRIVGTDTLKRQFDIMTGRPIMYNDMPDLDHTPRIEETAQSSWVFADSCATSSPITVDQYLKENLDSILGPASNPKSRDEICQSAGIDDNQIAASDDLGWLQVYPTFRETLRGGYQRAQSQNAGHGTLDSGFKSVRAALEGTIKLLICAAPRHLSPAIQTVVSVI